MMEIGISRLHRLFAPFLKTFRLLLVLGRVSNLPTVWSNCLAAWLLAGAGAWDEFARVCLGASLLYTGGMFLNDFFDEAFDLKYRPERPIPAGQINRNTVGTVAAMLLIMGWLLLIQRGVLSICLATSLLGNIVFYNAVHKKTGLAPWLMAGCRFLLYLVVGAASENGLDSVIFWAALALGAYIVGLSALARKEYASASSAGSGMIFIFLPVVLAISGAGKGGVGAMIPVISFVLWIFWCLTNQVIWARIKASRGVAGLLAGIVLVDWTAVSRIQHDHHFTFLSLFVLALLFQRTIPAT